jgi:hypothetical protein
MTQRILVLTGYFFRTLLFSLAGSIYVIMALVYWAIFFPPTQLTPDVENYVLVIGALGAGLAFLGTLTVAARAYQAENHPLIVRLPSRVEYLTAVLLSAIVFATLLEWLVSVLALFRGPDLALGQLFEIPPIWLSANILAAVLALHASDFVTKGWSRVYIYGTLALLLLGQSTYDTLVRWSAAHLHSLSRLFSSQGWFTIGSFLDRLAAWVTNTVSDLLSALFGFIFWPFRAIGDAVIRGFFDPIQALAPAIILLYATVLFILAADLFASKDLEFTE